MKTVSELEIIHPDWPAPATVHACTVCRGGGVSDVPYDSLNLGDHVDDDPAAVKTNRALLKQQLALPSDPRWLKQVHGVQVADAGVVLEPVEADAAYTHKAGVVCAVLTADCLPVLFCSKKGDQVAAAHAGWRGLLAGVLENTVVKLGEPSENLLAWMGPAIGPKAFEVGDEVREAFVSLQNEASEAFQPSPSGRWLADIYLLARQRLQRLGLTAVYGGDFCTYSDTHRFYSFRRDGVTGRMASLIWFE